MLFQIALQTLFVGIALLTMDRIGRLPLLLASSGGVTVSLLMLAVAFSLADKIPALAAVGLCLFMATFSIGWGPLAGVYLAEVFPLRIRCVMPVHAPFSAFSFWLTPEARNLAGEVWVQGSLGQKGIWG